MVMISSEFNHVKRDGCPVRFPFGWNELFSFLRSENTKRGVKFRHTLRNVSSLSEVKNKASFLASRCFLYIAGSGDGTGEPSSVTPYQLRHFRCSLSVEFWRYFG